MRLVFADTSISFSRAVWVDSLITGVAALAGRMERQARERESRDALVELYGAFSAYIMIWTTWAGMQINGPLGQLRLASRSRARRTRSSPASGMSRTG